MQSAPKARREGGRGVPARPEGDFPNMTRHCEFIKKNLERVDGSQRLLHRFAYFLMFINVSQGRGIDWAHPRGRHDPPDGRIAGSRGADQKHAPFFPFKKIQAYIFNFSSAFEVRLVGLFGRSKILRGADNVLSTWAGF